MDRLQKTLQKVEQYAKEIDASPDTVCRAATANPRLYRRLKQRVKYTDEVIEKLEQYIRDNPVELVTGAKRHISTHENTVEDIQPSDSILQSGGE